MGKSTCTVHVCLRLKGGFYLQRNTEEGLFLLFYIFSNTVSCVTTNDIKPRDSLSSPFKVACGLQAYVRERK